MSRRIEVELTSRRDDGSWTWRAAGAKQPKGTLNGELVPAGIAAGDVVRVDADFEIDGITVTAVLPPKTRSGKPESERIELLGPPERGGGSGTTSGVGTRRGGRKRDGERTGRRDGDRGPRARRKPRGERSDRDGAPEGATAKRASAPKQRRQRDGDNRAPRGRSADRAKRSKRSAPKPDTPDRPPRPKARKLRPDRKHRDALIASLPAEQQVVAEQVARGGLAAVRTEIEAQNRRAAAEGNPEVAAEGLISLAESLVGPLQSAEWRDRADAAISQIEKLDLRDLRSVLVAAEDFARDAEARELADRIRDGLNDRLERSQREWHDDLRLTLTEGRVVRALRLSSRPPKAGAPLPPEIAQELTGQANAALGSGASQHRIAVVLEAVAYSPVRPYVVLPNIPDEPEAELLEVVRRIADRLPEVATALGIDPTAARRSGRPRRGSKKQSAAASSKKADADQPNADTADDPAPETDTAETPADDASPESGDDASPELADDASPESGDDASPALGDAAPKESDDVSAPDDVAVEEVAHPA
ncbi:hypothetical protein [Candidatus Poriferisodalis sp.]|uniref:hypothetical protein n=1 Tax=Candidatus Poriferisodalis sp. TaxID=3101277 RepID=UPI003B5C0946